MGIVICSYITLHYKTNFLLIHCAEGLQKNLFVMKRHALSEIHYKIQHQTKYKTVDIFFFFLLYLTGIGI